MDRFRPHDGERTSGPAIKLNVRNLKVDDRVIHQVMGFWIVGRVSSIGPAFLTVDGARRDYHEILGRVRADMEEEVIARLRRAEEEHSALIKHANEVRARSIGFITAKCGVK